MKSTLVQFLFSVFVVTSIIRCQTIQNHSIPDSEHVSESDETEIYERRSIENSRDIQFIHSLPDIRKKAYEKATPGWDSGVTIEMIEASREVIETLKQQWITLAEFYPPNHFEGKSADEFIEEYIQLQSIFHYYKYEIDGPRSGGTIVGVLGSMDVLTVIEKMIEDTVYALVMYDDQFDFERWTERWNAQYN